MVLTGLEQILKEFPKKYRGKRAGILCHAASVNSNLEHIIDAVAGAGECKVGAVFGPQHGLYGQTQDNMIEWEGSAHPEYGFPVYSLYGKSRKPSKEAMEDIDVMIVDLQDAGARPYTYVWTLKLCMEACCESSTPMVLLDRPNPASSLPFDGPILSEEYFSFVGGAQIPLCHRMTMGEMAKLMKMIYFNDIELDVIWMKNWWRKSLWGDTGLPWVMPSPNMPCPETTLVYPGMVLLEATNLSEGRGTTRPFELFGAPYVDAKELLQNISGYDLPGCRLRQHDFIPSFQKWGGEYCGGVFIHIDKPELYKPVYTTSVILSEIINTTPNEFEFKPPPYEYETEKMPFDILSGNSRLRQCLPDKRDLVDYLSAWEESYTGFLEYFNSVSAYPEERS